MTDRHKRRRRHKAHKTRKRFDRTFGGLKAVLWQVTHEDLGRIEDEETCFGNVPVLRARLRFTPFVRQGDRVRPAKAADGVFMHESISDIPVIMAELSGDTPQARWQVEEDNHGVPARLLLALLGLGGEDGSVFFPQQP